MREVVAPGRGLLVPDCGPAVRIGRSHPRPQAIGSHPLDRLRTQTVPRPALCFGHSRRHSAGDQRSLRESHAAQKVIYRRAVRSRRRALSSTILNVASLAFPNPLRSVMRVGNGRHWASRLAVVADPRVVHGRTRRRDRPRAWLWPTDEPPTMGDPVFVNYLVKRSEVRDSIDSEIRRIAGVPATSPPTWVDDASALELAIAAHGARLRPAQSRRRIGCTQAAAAMISTLLIPSWILLKAHRRDG